MRGATDMVTGGRFQLGTAAARAGAEALDTPHVVKVVCADDGRALYFSRAPIPFLRDSADAAERDGCIRQHIGIYAYTAQALARWVALPPHALERIERLEQLRPLAAGMPMGVASVPEPMPGGIDTEDDLRRANERWPDLISELD
jgi:3-deoxy-manno-octulosonate cytidylyltransferase (CMP-KDO synthetase)